MDAVLVSACVDPLPAPRVARLGQFNALMVAVLMHAAMAAWIVPGVLPRQEIRLPEALQVVLLPAGPAASTADPDEAVETPPAPSTAEIPPLSRPAAPRAAGVAAPPAAPAARAELPLPAAAPPPPPATAPSPSEPPPLPRPESVAAPASPAAAATVATVTASPGPSLSAPASSDAAAAQAAAAPVARPATPAPPRPVVAPRFDADYLDNPAPPYPTTSRRLGEQGRVVLRVVVDRDGRASSVDVKTSSGWPRLDAAARETVRRWRFVPARQGDEAVEAAVLVPIEFEATDEADVAGR